MHDQTFPPGRVHLALARNNLLAARARYTNVSHCMGHDSVSGVTDLVQVRWRSLRVWSET